MSALTVLLVTHELLPQAGGCAKSTDRIAGILTSLGHRCVVAVFPEMYNGAPLVHADVPVLRRARWGHAYWHSPKPPDWSAPVYGAWVCACLQRLADQFHPAAVQLVYVGHLTLPTLLLTTQRRVPLIASLRGSDIYRDSTVTDGLVRLRAVADHAAVVTAVNHESGEIFRRLFPAARVPINVIPNSLDPTTRTRLRRLLYRCRAARSDRAEHGRVRLLLAGATRPHKGADDAVRALALLHMMERQEARLTIVGPSPADATGLTRLAADLGVAPFLRLLPTLPRRTLYRVLANQDIVLVPSWYEGSPNIVLEAAALERPLVLADVGAFRDSFAHGVHARLTLPRDPRALAEAVDYLLAHADERRRQVEHAGALLDSAFNYECERALWARLYDDLAPLGTLGPCAQPSRVEAEAQC